MKTKRVVLATTAVAVALTALLLLVFTFSFTQVARAARPSDAGAPAAPAAEVAARDEDSPVSPQQGLSVTFPSGDWPWYAHKEIQVHPEPPVAQQPIQICAEVVNHTPTLQEAFLEFGIADFGIGVPFVAVGQAQVVMPTQGPGVGCVNWVPPRPGHWCIQVRLIVPGQEDQVRQHNVDIDETHEIIFPVGPLELGGTVTFTVVNHMAPAGWRVELVPSQLDLRPGEVGTVTLKTTPLPGAVLGSREVIADVEGYVNGEPIGGIRKLDWPPVVLHRLRDPFFAESEITIHPYPVRAGEPTHICAELWNLGSISRTVSVQFSWAHFGIGLPFAPIGPWVTVEIPPHGRVNPCVTWVPPFEGHFCVQVRMRIEDQVAYHEQFSQRNLDVGEPLRPGQPHTIAFPVGNHQNDFTNPNPQPVTLTLKTDIHLPGWTVVLNPLVLPNMKPGEERLVEMTVTPPDALMPEDGTPVVDVWAAFDGPEGPHVIGGFRKVFRPPVPIHQPGEPPYGESEISVEPYPPVAGEPVEICTRIRNHTDITQTVQVFFDAANLGIGLPFVPFAPPMTVHLPPYSEEKVCTNYVFSYGGHFCVQVRIRAEGYREVVSQRNLDVAEILIPNQPDQFEIPVGNPFPDPVTITLGLINHMPNWEARLSQEVLFNVPPWPAPPIPVTLWITPTAEVLGLPDGAPVLDIEAYVEGQLIGGVRKVFRPPVPIHHPGDPVYAEREISVHPYPPRANEPTQVCVELRNPTSVTQTVPVQFYWANFGIGLPFHPIGGPHVVVLPPHSLVRECTNWIPRFSGRTCIQVEVQVEPYGTFYSQRNIDVGEPLRPGVPHPFPFPVGNPFERPVTITLGLIPHLPDWGLELSQDVLPNMQPGEQRVVTLTTTPPPGRPLPPDDTPVVDVEAYADGELIGGFRKIHRPPVPVHRPKDPVYAESEIGVDPYPALPGQPTKLSVEVYNPTDEDHIVTATFSVAPFGIGLPFSTTHITPNPVRIFVPARGAARGHVLWEPPAWRGKFCVQVELEMPGHEKVWSRRNIDVGEPLRRGEPHSLVFQVGSWPYTRPVTVTLGLVKHKPEWQVSLSRTVLPNVVPGQPVSVTLTVTPVADAPLGTGTPIVDVEAFVEGELLGGFRKLDIPPVPIHKPHEKSYAETEIIVEPDPPQQGRPTLVGSVVQNTGDVSATVQLEFGWAQFGMGIPFTTTGMTPSTRSVTLSPETSATVTVTWTPVLAGPQCIQVKLTDPEGEVEPQLSQRNVRVEERPPCGQSKVYSGTVCNTTNATVTVEIGYAIYNMPSNWVVTIVPSGTVVLGPGQCVDIVITVGIPCSLSAQSVAILQQEAGSVPTIDVEAYAGEMLLGGFEIQFPEEARTYLYLPIVMRLAP